MISYWSLSNGAKLVVEEIPHVRSAAIGIYIGVGSRHEPAGMKGASHFIEHMLFKGTEDLTARDIAERFEGIGGQLNAFTSKEYTCVYARTLDENINMAAEIMFDMVFNSRFHSRDFETEKGVVVEEINMNEDAPDDLIHDRFARRLWLDHPMGSPILGTLETVTGFNRDDVYGFYQASYIPSNMVISVAGNVQASAIKDLIEKLLSEQSVAELDFPCSNPNEYTGFLDLMEKDTEQVQICVGVQGLSYHDDQRYAMNVMNSILGGGMSSRLFQKLREELGLAYSIYSYPSNYSDTGSYSIYIGTGQNKIDQCFEALHQQIQALLNQGISEGELDRTRSLIKSSMYLGLESVMNRMSRLGKAIIMYDKIISPEEAIERVMQVEPEQIQDLAIKLLGDQGISVAAIGPAGVMQEVEKQYQILWG
ncbi:MAG: insulinase family protein [Syntrophomonadaceae bacterium]|jgi:predicted Zn-dependent peptidase|nr:insulinase family protein [Syntrophomonadaceae bacterium]